MPDNALLERYQAQVQVLLLAETTRCSQRTEEAVPQVGDSGQQRAYGGGIFKGRDWPVAPRFSVGLRTALTQLRGAARIWPDSGRPASPPNGSPNGSPKSAEQCV